MKPWERRVVLWGGGAGSGSPLDRDLERASLRMFDLGLGSQECARSLDGVVFNRDLSIDQMQTQELCSKALKGKA